MKDILAIGLISSLLYIGVGYNFIDNIMVLIFLSAFFSLGIFQIFTIYKILIKNKKSIAEVVSKEIEDGITLKSSRSFKYVFKVNNIKYYMPKGVSCTFEYYIGGSTIVYIDENNKTLLPRDELFMMSIHSFLLISITCFLLTYL